MTNKQLKRLAGIRLALSGIAVLLAGVMVFSGVMHFLVRRAPVPEEEPPAQTTEQQETTMETTPETIQPTAAPTESETLPTPSGASGTDEDHGHNGGGRGADPKPGNGGEPPVDPNGGNEEVNNSPNDGIDEADNGGEVENSPTDGGSGDLNPVVVEQEDNSWYAADSEPAESEDLLPAAWETEAESTAAESETDPTGQTTWETMADDDYSEPTGGQNITDLPDPTAATEAAASTRSSGPDLWGFLFWASASLLAMDLAAILVLSGRIKDGMEERNVKKQEQPAPAPRKLRQTPVVGTVHQVGCRDYQQDSLGHSAVLGGKGMLAVLADGMGGLSGGDKISQQIVLNMLTMGQQLKQGQTSGVLRRMLAQVNEDVNRTLGPEGLYKSGSTLVAVLVQGGEFQWIAVGDSRIYLYRQGYANQINRDHDQLQAWMGEVLEGKRSCEEVLRNPDGRKLTSFIGMGQLKQVDASLSPIELEPGDRLVLMSDGVYSVIGEDSLAAILKQYPDVNRAAAVIERLVKEAQNPYQDNFTAIILGF